MFTESAELYDTIYSAFKDYQAESDKVAALIRSAHPRARAILDVGCGTGEHAQILSTRHGYDVDGLDLDSGLLRIARAKVPRSTFHQADMADFSLPNRYDVIICLFSAIGYVRTLERVRQTLVNFRSHLVPGGVILVEPWFAPGVLRTGQSAPQTAVVGDTRVERASLVSVEGTISHVRFDYQIEDPSGIRRAVEDHVLGLFTPEEMLSSFREAGLVAEHDPVGLSDRGLYLARWGQPS